MSKRERLNSYEDKKEIETSLGLTMDNSIDRLANAMIGGIPYKSIDSSNDLPLNGGINANENNALFGIDYNDNNFIKSALHGHNPESYLNSVQPTTSESIQWNTGVFANGSATDVPAKRTLTANQTNAIKKFPSLVDYIGSSQGEEIAKEILYRINTIIAKQINANSQEITKTARACVADKQNIKQFFINDEETWVCVVTASGPFQGNEAFYFNKEKDQVAILRKDANDDYQNVTSEFNMIHESKEKNI